MIALICALLMTAFCAPPQELRESHDRALSFFPDGSYSLIRYQAPEQLRTFRIGGGYLELNGHLLENVLWPFAPAAYEQAHAGTLSSLRQYSSTLERLRQRKETRQPEATPGKLDGTAAARGRELLMRQALPGRALSIALFDCGELPMLIDQALREGTLRLAGKRPGCGMVYTWMTADAQPTVRAWCFCPTPDQLAVAVDEASLLAMADAAAGTVPNLPTGDFGAQLVMAIPDAAFWSVFPLQMQREERLQLMDEDAELGEEARLQWVRDLAAEPLVLVTSISASSEAVVERQLYRFADAASARAGMERYGRTPPLYNDPKSGVPQAVWEFEKRRIKSRGVRQDGETIVIDSAFSGDDLQQLQRLRRTYAAWYEQQEKRRLRLR